MKTAMKHTLKIPAAEYFKFITSDEFDRWAVEKIHLASRTEIEKSVTPDRLFKKVKMVSNPVSDTTRMWIKKDRVECIETFDANLRTGTFDWDFVPNVYADKIRLSAKGRVTDAGPEQCIREMTIDFTVKILIIGGQIEKKASARMEDAFLKINRFVEEFYRDNYKKDQA